MTEEIKEHIDQLNAAIIFHLMQATEAAEFVGNTLLAGRLREEYQKLVEETVQ